MFRDFGDRPPGTGGSSAAEAGAQENDVRSRQRLLDFLERFHCGIQPDFGIAPGSLPTRRKGAERHLHRGD